MSTAGALTTAQATSQPKVNPWIIGVAVSLAAFMEALDTSIANVALPHIAGSMGASNDESTWVLTSYLVSNAVVLPISGFLVGWLGRKRFFLMCVAFFTASSFLCGVAPSLGLLLLFRVLQGAFGGGLQPMTQAILADTFPPEKRGLAFALYGITVICGPAIGPTLGGWITDNYSWRWIFYINVPVGILAVLLVSQLIEDPPYLSRLKATMAKFDYVGFALLAVGVGALQVALDKGQEDDWFGSRFITTLIILAAVGLVSLVIWEWRHKEPIVDVHLFKGFNFASCNLMMFVLGAVSVQFNRTSASVPANAHGLHGAEGRHGHFDGGCSSGLSFAVRRAPRRTLSGPVPSRFRLDRTRCGHVFLMQAHRSTHQLSFCRVDAHLAVPAGWIFIRSAHDGYLCRPAGVKKQRCRRFDQLHAQYRAERRNLGGDYVACTAKSIPSVGPCGIHAVSSVRCGRRRIDEPSDTGRSQHALRPSTGTRQNVQRGDGTGASTLLRRYLLAARCHFRTDVLAMLPTCKK
jgi:MFS family permease